MTWGLRVSFCVLVLMGSSLSFAAGGGSSSKGITFAGSKRLALGYAMHSISRVDSTSLAGLTGARGISADYEMGMPFSICAGGVYIENKHVDVTWKGVTPTPIEFYGYFVNLSAKFTLPLGFFQPWIGAGYSWGVLTVSNPRDRETNSYLIGVYSRGSRAVRAPFGYGGVDLSFGTSGIRIAYTVRRSISDDLEEIGNQSLDMTLSTLTMGIFANF